MAPGTPLNRHERIVVVVGCAADADIVSAGGGRLKRQLRIAPLLVVERQRRAVGAENPQQAVERAAGVLGADIGVELSPFSA